MSQTLRRVEIYRSIGKIASAGQRAFEAFHSAVFMGLLDEEIFEEHTTYPFGAWEGALRVADDREPMPSWVAPTLAGRVGPKGRILVVAAGGGREITGLVEAGYEVIATEQNRPLEKETRLALEERGLGGIRFLPFADIENGRVDETFDAILIARFFLSYRRGRESRVRLLRSLKSRLVPGGTLAADYFIRPDRSIAFGSLLFRGQPAVANHLRRLRGKTGRLVEPGDHLDPTVPVYHHHYTTSGLASELAEAGLEPIETGKTWFGWTLATPVEIPLTPHRPAPVRRAVTA